MHEPAAAFMARLACLGAQETTESKEKQAGAEERAEEADDNKASAATMAASAQLATLTSGLLLRARKALVAAKADDLQQLAAPAPVIDALLPLLLAFGAVADNSDSHTSKGPHDLWAANKTVALTGPLDQALECVDQARAVRAAAFNDELCRTLSISPAVEEDGKCAFLPASQLFRLGAPAPTKNGRARDEAWLTQKSGRRS